MARVCWLLVVAMACACIPGFGSKGWNSSICNKLGYKGRIQDCIHLCKSAILTEFPDLDASALEVIADDHLLQGIILSSRLSKNQILPESGVRTDHGEDRRSYNMEHFRWGKPSGRKRRPVKVFASSLEGGGGSFEGSFPPKARRHLSIRANDAKDFQEAKVSPKSHVELDPKPRKAYRMSHFRWGSPTASKRNGSLMKRVEEKRQRQLAKLFRYMVVKKDVQRIMG